MTASFVFAPVVSFPSANISMKMDGHGVLLGHHLDHFAQHLLRHDILVDGVEQVAPFLEGASSALARLLRDMAAPVKPLGRPDEQTRGRRAYAQHHNSAHTQQPSAVSLKKRSLPLPATTSLTAATGQRASAQATNRSGE